MNLFKQEDGISLGAFRMFFGIIMALQFVTFREQIPMFVDSAVFLFTYDFFHWIKPFPEPYLTAFISFLVVNSLVFASGRLYRLTAILQFMGMFYCFHIGKALYNNHYYLFILLCLLMVFVQGNASLVLFKKGSTTVSVWQRMLIKAQLVIVFFYGGIAKMNTEWLLNFQPIKSWLPEMLGVELMQLLSDNQLVIIAGTLSYFGLIFDLIIGFLLLNKRTRLVGVPLYLSFHLMNAIFFKIGLFPWFCMGALCLFVEQEKLQTMKLKARQWFLNDKGATQIEESKPTQGVRYMLVLGLFYGWILFQLLIPLRHWAVEGWVLWDERAYNFSWFMKLRTKEPTMSIRLRFGDDPTDYYLELEKFLTKKQGRSIGFKPMNLIQFAHLLEDYYQQQGETEDVKVYAEVITKLHDHEPQLMVDPHIDLTTINVSNTLSTEAYPWIVSFKGK